MASLFEAPLPAVRETVPDNAEAETDDEWEDARQPMEVSKAKSSGFFDTDDTFVRHGQGALEAESFSLPQSPCSGSSVQDMSIDELM